jgi:hypothetical protein
MKTFIIESRVSRIETTEVKATSRENALKFAENNPHLNWKPIHDEEERTFVSIS